ALRVPRLPPGGPARRAAPHHAAVRRGAEAGHARAALDLPGAGRRGAGREGPGRAGALPRHARRDGHRPRAPLRPPSLRGGARGRGLRWPGAPGRRVRRLRRGRLHRERGPGGERHARLRRPRLRLVRHLERGRDRRAHRARPPPALALRSLLRLRAGRDRQPRRGLPARLRGALPLPGAPLARRARLARPLMRRPALLLGVQVAAVTARLAVAGTPTVATYFVVGHGEHDPRDTDERRGASEAARSLAAEGFRTGVLEGAAAVPADAGLVVVAGPTRDLRPAEVEALAAYVAGGGDALFLCDPGTPPSVAALVRRFGV